LFFIQTVLQILFTRDYTLAVDVTKLLQTIPAQDIDHFVRHMLEIQIGAHLGFLTTIWCIKFSFLFFYRRLASGMPTSKLWVFTCVFSFLAWAGNIIGFFFVCVPLKTYFDSKKKRSFQTKTLLTYFHSFMCQEAKPNKRIIVLNHCS